jgi:hypothetical protein
VIHIVTNCSSERIICHTQNEYAATCQPSSISHCDAGLRLHRTWFADEFANSSEGWTFGVPAGAVTAASLVRDHSSNDFDEGGAAEGRSRWKNLAMQDSTEDLATEDLATNDDVVPEAGRYEALRLIKAFLRLTDPGRRGRVLDLAEQLAAEAVSAAAGATCAATEAPPLRSPNE